MKASELEELGFKKFYYGLELSLNNKLSLEIWLSEPFITLSIKGKLTELKNVNTIEKVKQLIELLK